MDALSRTLEASSLPCHLEQAACPCSSKESENTYLSMTKTWRRSAYAASPRPRRGSCAASRSSTRWATVRSVMMSMGLLCCWYALALEHVFVSSQLCSPAASSASAYAISDGWQKWLQELPGHLLTAELLATQRSEVPHGHRLAAVSQLIKRLPDRNRAVLQSVLEFADNVCPRTQRWSRLYH
jgi:hypothetical protein